MDMPSARGYNETVTSQSNPRSHWPKYFITDAGVGYRFQPVAVHAVPGTA
jgi:hypothetical protein